MAIERVCIIGAGTIGSLPAGGLEAPSDAREFPAFDLGVVARGATG